MEGNTNRIAITKWLFFVILGLLIIGILTLAVIMQQKDSNHRKEVEKLSKEKDALAKDKASLTISKYELEERLKVGAENTKSEVKTAVFQANTKQVVKEYKERKKAITDANVEQDINLINDMLKNPVKVITEADTNDTSEQ
jgi:uncharacterized protein YpmS